MSLISLNLSESEKIRAKQTGLTHRMLYLRGLNHFFGQAEMPKQQAEEIAEVRKRLEKLSGLLNHYVVQAAALEDEIKMLKGGKDVV